MKVAIVGAGLIGTYIGGCLCLANPETISKVHFYGRSESQKKSLAQNGLTIRNELTKKEFLIETERFEYHTDFESLSDCDLIIFSVKLIDNKSTSEQIKKNTNLKHSAILISFQNGLDGAEMLRNEFPNFKVLSAMVGANVVGKEEIPHFSQTTDSPFVIEYFSDKRIEALISSINIMGLSYTSKNIVGVQWTKLLMNEINAVSALSGKNVFGVLSNWKLRKVYVESIKEGLIALDRAGIQTEKIKVDAHKLTLLLDVPAWIFALIQPFFIKIDRNAKTSMQVDLEKKRMTEVNYLNGKIVSLARKVQITVPVNHKLVELVQKAEKASQGCPMISEDELYDLIPSEQKKTFSPYIVVALLAIFLIVYIKFFFRQF